MSLSWFLKGVQFVNVLRRQQGDERMRENIAQELNVDSKWLLRFSGTRIEKDNARIIIDDNTEVCDMRVQCRTIRSDE